LGRAIRSLYIVAVIAALVGIPALMVAGGAVAQEADPKIAVLQGLDKVTARVSTIQAPIDEAVQFGTLLITARTCSKTPPEETPETTVFLEVVEVRSGELSLGVFSGWMFASSPALSAMEHPVYDVWVIDCKSINISLPEVPAANR
jgi:hypothetical protein